MAEYKPLFVYLEPASIPQVVAHIQKYLSENPIVSDPESIAEAIRDYIEEHPEIIAVASVNGKTGNVVLNGSDININASSAVSIETQLLNLASMINSVGADITQIQANISQIYTDIETLQTDVETNASNISALQTSVEGQGTRLATAETDIDSLETAQTAQGTRLNTAEGNISSLQTRIAQAETNINSNTSSIGVLNESLQLTNENVESIQNDNTIKSGDSFLITNRFMVVGLITGASASLWFTIYLGKKITASSVSISALTATMRGVTGYLEASGSHNLIGTGYTALAYISDANTGIITLNVTKSTAFANATNNTPVVLEFLPNNFVLNFS